MNKLLVFAITTTFIFISLVSAYSQNPLCEQKIEGVSINSTISEADLIWKSKGFTDLTCTRRSKDSRRSKKLSCEDRRKKFVEYTTGSSRNDLKVGDKVFRFTREEFSGNIKSVKMKMKVDAPKIFFAHQSDRDWSGWSHKDLIESKINEFCGDSPPEGLLVDCNFSRGVNIQAFAGNPQKFQCKYIFEARYTHHKPNPPDHSIFESVIQKSFPTK